jgi:hypothetical protein
MREIEEIIEGSDREFYDKLYLYNEVSVIASKF